MLVINKTIFFKLFRPFLRFFKMTIMLAPTSHKKNYNKKKKLNKNTLWAGEEKCEGTYV